MMMCSGLIFKSCFVYSKVHIELPTEPVHVDTQHTITQQITQIYLKIRFFLKVYCHGFLFSYFSVCVSLCVGK